MANTPRHRAIEARAGLVQARQQQVQGCSTCTIASSSSVLFSCNPKTYACVLPHLRT